jgi:hypothetical protein
VAAGRRSHPAPAKLSGVMTAKEFAKLLPEIFTPAQVAWIRRQTRNGPSALQIVQRALSAAIKHGRAESERVGKEALRMIADGSWRQ